MATPLRNASRARYENENYGQGVFPLTLTFTLLAECVIFVFVAWKTYSLQRNNLCCKDALWSFSNFYLHIWKSFANFAVAKRLSADMAQLVEQRIRNAWVTSSSLVIGSTRTRLRGLVLFCFAAIAQLVEQRLPKPQVTGSSPACRSSP